MMLLTDYYRFQKDNARQSKSRRDAEATTKSYQPFEALRNRHGELFLYLSDVPDQFNDRIKKRAVLSLTKTKNISSIIMPEINLPFGYGDFVGTTDAMLIVFNPDFSAFEVFLGRGLKHQKHNLFIQLKEGELDEEMEALRKKAIPEK